MSAHPPPRLSRGFLRYALPLLVAGAALLWWRSPSTSTAKAPASAPPEPLATSTPASAPPLAPSAAYASAKPASATPPATATETASPAALDEATPPDEEITRAAQERIDALVVTYAKESLPALAVFLTHREPAVREAARDGFLQMGLTEGAAHLRAASDQIRDPREAVQLLDAADFLDLPAVPSTGGRTVRPVSPSYRERLQKERTTERQAPRT